MAKSSQIFPIFILIVLFIIHVEKSQPLTCPVPSELTDKLNVDPAAIESASTDYGNIVHDKPAAVLYPSSAQDISSLIQASFNCSTPFGIAARGNGHSTRGQGMAYNGVVIDMNVLRDNRNGTGINISKDPLYVDVGGEQLWVDVLNATVTEDVAPVSWTDFLGLTVGGTLSNAGISGQTFRFGPQISNVHEMDVITGKGEFVTCSANNNSELFYAVLGGLGQFGIITRARISLGPAFKRAVWAQILYSNFSAFTRDQERFIAGHAKKEGNAISYLEGALLLDNGTPNTWRTSFFPKSDIPRITSLIKQHGILYSLEIANSFDELTNKAVQEEMKDFIKALSSKPDYIYHTNVSYLEFLNRVQIPDEQSQAHPWLNLFIPKSNISDFNSGVFRDIVLQRNITTGPVLFYPMMRNKWDNRMSVAIPDEDIFYTAALLYSSGLNEWQVYDDQNKEILEFCDKAGIQGKQYLPNYATKEEWTKQFGSNWTTFEQRKALFDPKMILSPGQRIFNTN
ncbi:cytokinin dehydrogenase 3 [Ricinus communis]|uniref:cytokinin dehydrogenase n=1 Tax=Ricinus communis TaxID=3988 RepID=B9RI30_RICCO|nr:cytokinin dehydrogenase 3 [Ricinus communis]EEF48802.1 gulonolactone oxidase, putative [Ricinus communis]|eukprot:XP_002513399.1 cytokinin dehydrogenase 3 [Ricinus communis]